MNKEVKIVPLIGKDIAEIEAVATAAVNEGGSVIGMTNVGIKFEVQPDAHVGQQVKPGIHVDYQIPALVIIRKAAPAIDIDGDEVDDGDAV